MGICSLAIISNEIHLQEYQVNSFDPTSRLLNPGLGMEIEVVSKDLCDTLLHRGLEWDSLGVLPTGPKLLTP